MKQFHQSGVLSVFALCSVFFSSRNKQKPNKFKRTYKLQRNNISTKEKNLEVHVKLGSSSYLLQIVVKSNLVKLL